MSLAQLLMLPSLSDNALPTITVPGAQSATSNVAKAITGTSITDTDSNPQTVTLSVSHGTIFLASLTGLTGSGNGTNSLSYVGALAAINTAIATLTYTSTTDYEGADTLAISTSDGAGGSDSDTVAITVTWTPESIGANLLAWFDPSVNAYSDAGTTPAVADDLLYQWISRAGSATITATQATSGNRPTYKVGANGKSWIYSAGDNRGLITDYTTDYRRNITVAVQLDPTDGGSSDAYSTVVSKNDGVAGGWLIGKKNTTEQFGITEPNVAGIAYDADSIGDAWHACAVTISSNALSPDFKVYVDGTIKANVNAAQVGVSVGSTINILCNSPLTSGNWKQGCGHIVLLTTEADSTLIGKLNTFMAAQNPT